MSQDGTPLYSPVAMRSDIEGLRSDFRDDLQDHARQDLESFRRVSDRFDVMKAEIDHINQQLAGWGGAIALLKVFAVIGIPSVLSAAITLVVHVIRHW